MRLRNGETAAGNVAGVLRNAAIDVSTPTYQAPDDGKDAPGACNVIAQTRTRDPAHVVTIGAHLSEGPSIVNDGSGVASVLEIATRLGAGPPVHDTVRLAFFGNEETGPQGSSGYLRGLSVQDRKKIAMYLNVDMVASPNAGYFVRRRGSDEKSAGPAGSAVIGRELADQLARIGVKPELIRVVGDEAPFIKAGIPVGDVKKKTAEQAIGRSGQAGEPYDRCYHKACDRIDDVNRDALDHYPGAVAGRSPTSQTRPVNRPDTPGTTSSRCPDGRVAAQSRRPSGPHDHRRRAANGTAAQ